MSASAVLSVSSLSPEAETDSPQAEVAGDDTLTLYPGQVLTGHEYYSQGKVSHGVTGGIKNH